MSDPAAVRPEYAALAAEFVTLSAAFGHEVDAALRADIAQLAATIECIDRHVDAVARDAERRAMWSATLALLETGASSAELLDAGAGSADLPKASELRHATLAIRAVALRRGVLARLVRVVRKEIATSEELRQTRDPRAYVMAVLREGRLTAALALILSGSASSAAFRRFFFRLSGPANVIDKLRDARGDEARGEIRLRTGIALHARLALAVLVRLPALFRCHPRAWQVVGMGLRYLRGTTRSPTLGTAA